MFFLFSLLFDGLVNTLEMRFSTNRAAGQHIHIKLIDMHATSSNQSVVVYIVNLGFCSIDVFFLVTLDTYAHTQPKAIWLVGFEIKNIQFSMKRWTHTFFSLNKFFLKKKTNKMNKFGIFPCFVLCFYSSKFDQTKRRLNRNWTLTIDRSPLKAMNSMRFHRSHILLAHTHTQPQVHLYIPVKRHACLCVYVQLLRGTKFNEKKTDEKREEEENRTHQTANEWAQRMNLWRNISGNEFHWNRNGNERIAHSCNTVSWYSMQAYRSMYLEIHMKHLKNSNKQLFRFSIYMPHMVDANLAPYWMSQREP